MVTTGWSIGECPRRQTLYGSNHGAVARQPSRETWMHGLVTSTYHWWLPHQTWITLRKYDIIENLRYHIYCMDIDPPLGRNLHNSSEQATLFYPSRLNYGAPVRRDRVYILLIRNELLSKSAKQNFENFASTLASELMHESQVDWWLALTYTRWICYLLASNFWIHRIGYFSIEFSLDTSLVPIYCQEWLADARWSLDGSAEHPESPKTRKPEEQER